MSNLLLINALAILLLMTITWVVSLRLRDASIIDPIWGLGFVLVVVGCVVMRSFDLAAWEWLLVSMTTAWGLRLFFYLAWRKLREREEDRRYAAMREHWGSSFWWASLITIFSLQAAVLWFIALPLQLALQSPRELAGGQSMFGFAILLWSIGLFFETVSDWQLACFKGDTTNAGRVLDTGLWRYSRHPNYFGDFCVWWGLWIASYTLGAPLWSVVSPLAMSILLMKISGVTLTEKTIASRCPEYAEYQRRTSSFFPWPPAR